MDKPGYLLLLLFLHQALQYNPGSNRHKIVLDYLDQMRSMHFHNQDLPSNLFQLYQMNYCGSGSSRMYYPADLHIPNKENDYQHSHDKIVQLVDYLMNSSFY